MSATVLSILTMLFGGVLAGLWFFGGLYWTVRRLPRMRRPWLWAMVSFWLRSAVCGAAFYCMAAGGWHNAVIGLMGFLMARGMMVRKLKPEEPM